MIFTYTPERKDGNRIYGCDGTPILSIRADTVINGDWTVTWLDDTQLRGQCARRPRKVFEYMFHAPDDEYDYNKVLSAASVKLVQTV